MNYQEHGKKKSSKSSEGDVTSFSGRQFTWEAIKSTLDLCWDVEDEEAHNVYSIECMAPLQDLPKCSLKEPVISEYGQDEENISSPPSAEIEGENSRIQKKIRKLKRSLREYKVLVKVV